LALSCAAPSPFGWEHTTTSSSSAAGDQPTTMGNAQGGCCSADGSAHPRQTLWDTEQASPFRDNTVATRDYYSDRLSRADSSPLDATPPPCDGTLIVNVVSCSNLTCPTTGKRGAKAPDSYVRLHLGAANQSMPQQTAVVDRSRSPTFDESFEFRLAAGASHAASALTVAVMSKSWLGINIGSGSSGLLGEAQVSVRQAFSGRWTERVGGEWELGDVFTRGVTAQQRGHGGVSESLGTVELQLRFRPDVPSGMGLTLLPPSKRLTQILAAGSGKAVVDVQLTPPPSDGWLRVHVRRCSGLLPTGNGTTNSLVSLSVGGGEGAQTDEHLDTLSPRFDQSFEFFLDKGAPPGSCLLLLKAKSPNGDFLGELELQPCAEFAPSNWKRRVKREYSLTDRLNRAPPREKKKRQGQPSPCGTVALTLDFTPATADSLSGEEAAGDPWAGLTPANWRSGYTKPDREARQQAEARRAGRLPPTHVH
jgi:hypothetical protein